MNRFVAYIAGASVPLSLWSCSSDPSDAGSHAQTSVDAAGGDTPAQVDAGSDAGFDGASSTPDGSRDAPSDGGASDDAMDAPDACTGSVAVVGGTVAGASTIAFAATLVQGGAWAVSSLPPTISDPPRFAASNAGSW